MRKVVASGVCAVGVFAALVSVAATARAQQPPPRPTPNSPQSVWTLQRDQLGATASADTARARARKGDCAGALEAFDAALRVTVDPALRRDRGLCHERLGNPFPAIDDFRAYLSAMPDQPDADDIRDRLGRLEKAVGIGGPVGKTGDVRADDDPWKKGNAGAGAGGSMKVGVGGKPTTYDSAALEAADESSALRRGTGWILAPYVGGRKWFAKGGFSSSLWAETVGLRLAYAWSDTSSLLLEAGYERFNTIETDIATISGLSSQIAYEARLPFSQSDVDNFWILGVGFGYEHLSVSANGIQATGSTSFGGVLGRGRFGYRRNLGAKAAVEFTLDGGGGKFFAYSGGGGSTGTGMLGLNVALLWGL